MILQLSQLILPLAHFTLEVNTQINARVTAICGPSGAGKTTFLDLIAGLRRPAAGQIHFNDNLLNDTKTGKFIPPRLRQIGYVPQDLALFPHLSVRQNLLYGHKVSNDATDRNVLSYDHVIAVLQIDELQKRRITHLSGGEKQRVALGRALLTAPRLLLLDEPLASLDTDLRQKIIPYLARIRDEFHVPMLYVTHDLKEISALCDHVLRMERGKLTESSN